ncbi:MAG: ion channel [Polyangiales bacterium]
MLDLLRAGAGLMTKVDGRTLVALGAATLASASDQGLDVSPRGLHRALRQATESDPLATLGATVLGSAWLFFLAERGENPKVTSYWDALVFISTCLSVGYADVFARTPAGKAIASAIMTCGPALSGAALDPSASERVPDEAIAVQRAILDKLDQLLVVMRDAQPAK